MTKLCTRCQESRTRDLFHRDQNARDGLRPWCKLCYADYAKEYRERTYHALKIRRASVRLPERRRGRAS